ncbi:hypothetical protein HAPAU_32350 [Halalkalicoccus paucihalophilus]|uniref:SHOCT domain-containing protein n=1 Tax=Halalkalicoccus paucihalophilus TaxID=1008153 RepID=A0A151AAY3_9EURY|nr:hypothetical protein [Halalkalicoccus paucihalophilus]KYH24858.1 hypothetical protein HAPAU_32350 [Halalkalicoccus paucihalophilus]
MANDSSIVRLFFLIGFIILLVPLLMMVLFMPMMWGMGMWGQMGQWGGLSGMGWMGLLMWFFLLLIIIGTSYIIYKIFLETNDQDTDPALRELRISYARGELSEEEFEQRHERLQREN